jgi:hypothetical protein
MWHDQSLLSTLSVVACVVSDLINRYGLLLGRHKFSQADIGVPDLRTNLGLPSIQKSRLRFDNFGLVRI